MKTVAIVGGGFCGTVTAVNLARLATDPLRVLLINGRSPLGRGIAYGTDRPEHLLNVVARNMSAFPDLPSHFVDWLRNRADFAGLAPAELREQFVPRRVYGDYLQDLLFWHAEPLAGAGRVPIHRIEDEVVDIAPIDEAAQLVLKGGELLQADRVVLATGNLTPHDLIPEGPLRAHPAYCANPWGRWHEKLPDVRQDVLLVGTGLTMIDSFLTLQQLGWEGTIHAVSRTGLLPLSHFKGTDDPTFPPEDVATMGLRQLVALVEENCARLRREGRNPAIVVDKLRPYTQRIWRNLSVEDKGEFCRRHRTRWNVVRHRIPPTVAEKLEAARALGRLRIHSGRLGGVEADGARLRVRIEPTDGRPPEELDVAFLVNCTGPRESFGDAPDRLFQRLSERGLIRPDELDMGLEVAPDFAVVDGHGRPSDVLFAIGPLLRGTLWETTAVPELRSQAHQVAQAVLSEDRQHLADWAPETPVGLVEYYI